MYSLTKILTAAETLLFFGITAAALSTFAYLPYIRDTIAGRTKPQRASWLIWSVLSLIAFFSQIFEGATSSLWFAGVQAGATVIIFVLSIWVGKGRFLSHSDYLILAAAALGLVLWYQTDNAAYALAITISISLLGGLATAVKAYHDPESETLMTWVICFIASVFAALSVGAVDFTLLAYPLYLFLLNLSFIVAIAAGRARTKSVAPTATIRPLSFAMLTSGLRTAADAVIVGAAFIFAFSWFDTILSANDASAGGINSTTESIANSNVQPANVQQANVQQADERFGDVHTNGVQLLPILATSLTVAESADSKATGRFTSASKADSTPLRGTHVNNSQIIVVAIGPGDPARSILRPLILHDSDPLAKLARAQVRDWLDDGMALASSIADDAQTEASQAVAGVLPESISPDVVYAKRATGEIQGYLELDEDDPFASLIVTSDTAVLLQEGEGVSGLSAARLQRGTRLQALATNGEWFRVQVDGGLERYIHNSEVEFERSASFTVESAG